MNTEPFQEILTNLQAEEAKLVSLFEDIESGDGVVPASLSYGLEYLRSAIHPLARFIEQQEDVPAIKPF